MSDRDSWRTPPEVFRWASGLIGGFDYDAACTSLNCLAPPLWERAGFRAGDSTSHKWPDGARIWLNPPYSNPDPLLRKALACSSITCALIMSPNGEARFEALMKQSHEIAIVGWRDGFRDCSGRISFIGPNGKPVSGNTRGSSLFIINAPEGRGQRSFIRLEEVMRIGALNDSCTR